MPYNTRRKSLSLAELGIIVPKRSRAESHPSPPSTVAEGEEPPVKKSKRSHGSASPPPASVMSPPRTTTIRIKEEAKKPGAELSPPPSPTREGKVDVDGISDEIVIAAIQQLEKTGNRPHLVKELAHVLATHLPCVDKSANPSALISSRLTAYLNRSWPAISPCPLAKNLSPMHPRRLYFYLTTSPHQPIPEAAEPLPKQQRIISPSLSSASALDEEDEGYTRRRTQLSPSPEVDLSSPELDEDNAEELQAPGGPFSARNSVPRDSRSSSLSHRRAASPQLEHEERDFKQTANHLFEAAQLARRHSLEKQQQQQKQKPHQQPQHQQQDVKMEYDATAGIEGDGMSVAMSIEDNEEMAAKKNSDDAAALFGQAGHHLKLPADQQHLMDFSSPVIQPLRPDHPLNTTHDPSANKSQQRIEDPMEHLTLDLGCPITTTNDMMMLPDAAFAWDALLSPENIELAELEDMFDAY